MERLLLFTDAVFAIVVTLLALDIHLADNAQIQTNQAVLDTVSQMASKFGAYALSFIVIALLWNTDLRRYRYLVAVNGKFVAGKMLQLMLVGLIPFATSLIARSNNSLSVTIYAANIVAYALIAWGTWTIAARNPSLISPDLSAQVRRAENLRALSTALIFGVSIGIAWLSPTVGMLSWALQFPANRIIARSLREGPGD
jgi:uncharacterized membrane protein